VERKAPVRIPGKKVGPKTYVHWSALEESDLPVAEIAMASRLIPSGWAFQVVRYDSKTGQVAFVQAPGFDEEDEPVIGEMIVVEKGDDEAVLYRAKDKPQIYHHKWMFVADDYDGFDVEASKSRTERINKLNLDKSRIGYKHIWDEEVIPLLVQEDKR
jgi:hypothetical protein